MNSNIAKPFIVSTSFILIGSTLLLVGLVVGSDGLAISGTLIEAIGVLLGIENFRRARTKVNGPSKVVSRLFVSADILALSLAAFIISQILGLTLLTLLSLIFGLGALLFLVLNAFLVITRAGDQSI